MDETKKWVEEARANGLSTNEIVRQLRTQKWADKDINALLTNNKKAATQQVSASSETVPAYHTLTPPIPTQSQLSPHGDAIESSGLPALGELWQTATKILWSRLGLFIVATILTLILSGIIFGMVYGLFGLLSSVFLIKSIESGLTISMGIGFAIMALGTILATSLVSAFYQAIIIQAVLNERSQPSMGQVIASGISITPRMWRASIGYSLIIIGIVGLLFAIFVAAMLISDFDMMSLTVPFGIFVAIVSFVFFTISLFTFFAVAEKEFGIIDALNYSGELVRGHWLAICGRILLVTIPYAGFNALVILFTHTDNPISYVFTNFVLTLVNLLISGFTLSYIAIMYHGLSVSTRSPETAQRSSFGRKIVILGVIGWIAGASVFVYGTSTAFNGSDDFITNLMNDSTTEKIYEFNFPDGLETPTILAFGGYYQETSFDRKGTSMSVTVEPLSHNMNFSDFLDFNVNSIQSMNARLINSEPILLDTLSATAYTQTFQANSKIYWKKMIIAEYNKSAIVILLESDQQNFNTWEGPFDQAVSNFRIIK